MAKPAVNNRHCPRMLHVASSLMHMVAACVASGCGKTRPQTFLFQHDMFHGQNQELERPAHQIKHLCIDSKTGNK